MGIFETSAISFIGIVGLFLAFGLLIAFISTGFSSFNSKNEKNKYPVDGKWLTANQIFDRYM